MPVLEPNEMESSKVKQEHLLSPVSNPPSPHPARRFALRKHSARIPEEQAGAFGYLVGIRNSGRTLIRKLGVRAVRVVKMDDVLARVHKTLWFPVFSSLVATLPLAPPPPGGLLQFESWKLKHLKGCGGGGDVPLATNSREG